MKKYIKSTIEIVVINLIAYILLYRINPNPERFFQLNPHPLLIVLIVFSLLYGNKIGLIASTVTTCHYIALFYLTYGNIGDYIFQIEFFKYPLLFFGLTLVVGMVVDNHVNEQEELKEQNELFYKNYTKLNKEFSLAKEAIDELKEQIIESDSSILALYDIAKRLQELNEEEILTETVGIMNKYLKANKVAIYDYQGYGDYLRLKIAIGWNEEQAPNSLNINEEVYLEQVLLQQKILRYVDIQTEHAPLLVGPIVKDYAVIGVVCIDDMVFGNISNYSYTLFKVILDWVGLSLENAKLIASNQNSYIDDTQILRFETFQKRLASEKRRKKEYYLDYKLLCFNSAYATMEKAILLKSKLRSIDYVTVKGKNIYVVLPAINSNVKPVISEMIASRVGLYLEEVEIGDEL